MVPTVTAGETMGPGRPSGLAGPVPGGWAQPVGVVENTERHQQHHWGSNRVVYG